MTQITVSGNAAGKTCPYCRFPLKSGITAESCDACQTLHHQECWEEGGGCAVFGCANSAAVARGGQAPAPQAPVAPPVTVTHAAPGSPMAYPAWNTPTTFRTGVEINGAPLEFWAVVTLIAAAGVYLLQLGLRALPDAFRFFSYFGVSRAFAFVLVVLLLLIAALGAGLLVLAWSLTRRSRVARGLTYVTVGCLTTAVLFGSGTTTGEVLSMLGGLAAAAILGLSPAVRPLFTGEDAPDSDQPTGLIVARVSIVVWLILLGVAAVLNFCLASFGGKYAALGVFETLIVLGGIVIYRRLAFADRQARLIATAGAAAAFILLLVGWHDLGFSLMLGLSIAIPICLWIPADVRAFFGDQPIVVARQSA